MGNLQNAAENETEGEQFKESMIADHNTQLVQSYTFLKLSSLRKASVIVNGKSRIAIPPTTQCFIM